MQLRYIWSSRQSKFQRLSKNLSANFISNLILIKSFLPFMLKKKHGHIINIASGTGIFWF